MRWVVPDVGTSAGMARPRDAVDDVMPHPRLQAARGELVRAGGEVDRAVGPADKGGVDPYRLRIRVRVQPPPDRGSPAPEPPIEDDDS